LKKMFALVFLLLCLLFFVGCGEQQQAKELPVPAYPLSKELVATAIEKTDLPSNLSIEENDLLEYEGIASTSYTLRHPTKDLFAGACMGILSHKSDKFTSLGLTISTIDQTEELTGVELEQAVRFATYLFWEDEHDTRILDSFMKGYVDGQPYLFEEEIDGIDCQIAYAPNNRQLKLKIAFSTDMEAQLGAE